MVLNPEEGKVFGKISEIYDKTRVDYPKKAIDDILQYSKLKSESNVLDVGCGTGQLIMPLANRGLQVLGLDISKEMIDVARRKSSSFEKCDYLVKSFETAKFPDGKYDLVVSGMAWHWVTSKDRYDKLHRILKKDGSVAFLWSYQEKENSAYVKEVGKILDKYDKVDRGPSGSLVKESIKSAYNELKESGLFTSLKKRTYQADIEFTKQRYLDLIISYGWVQVLPKEKINEMIRDILTLHEKYTDPIMIPYKYEMILAKKA